MTNDASTSELQTRIHSIPSHGSADRDMVAAENMSALGAHDPTPSELAAVERWVRTEGRRRVREKLDEIDRKNVGTPRTRLPWEEGK